MTLRTMNKFRNSILITCCAILLSNANGQTTFWAEDFNGYIDGATAGENNNSTNPAADWTSGGCTTCGASADDWWEIRSGVMEARDVNGEHVFLQTEPIDISNYTSVTINVDVLEDGDLEGLYLGGDDCSDAFNQDYADIEYRINGGTWTLVQNYLGWCGLYASCGTHTLYGDDNTSGDCRTTDADWESTTVTVSGLSGDTIELRLSATNYAGTELIRFDNIDIQFTSVLPIELVSFTAKPFNSQVYLSWQTASETNNNYFTIEHSTNAVTWEKVIDIAGAGNSAVPINYSTTHFSPNQGVSYYRLKQTDFDGKVEYSHIRSIDNQELEDKTVVVYPNPFHDQVSIEGNFDELEDIVVYNLLGINVTPLTKSVIVNNSKSTLDLSQLSAGTYFIRTKNTASKVYKR